MTQQTQPTQAERLAAVTSAAGEALSVTLAKPGVLTSEYRSLIIAQWILVGINALVWATFAFSTHLPAWAPTIVSSVSGLVIANIQTNYTNNRTSLKQTSTEAAS